MKSEFFTFSAAIIALLILSQPKLYAQSPRSATDTIKLKVSHSDYLAVEGVLSGAVEEFEVPNFRGTGLNKYIWTSLTVTKVIHASSKLTIADPALLNRVHTVIRYDIPVIWDARFLEHKYLLDRPFYVLEYNPTFEVYEINILLQSNEVLSILKSIQK